MIRWAVAIGVALNACATTLDIPTVPAPPDACEAACARRQELGCLEAGLESACVPVCRRAALRGLYDPACAARAETVADMAACHVRCGGVP